MRKHATRISAACLLWLSMAVASALAQAPQRATEPLPPPIPSASVPEEREPVSPPPPAPPGVQLYRKPAPAAPPAAPSVRSVPPADAPAPPRIETRREIEPPEPIHEPRRRRRNKEFGTKLDKIKTPYAQLIRKVRNCIDSDDDEIVIAVVPSYSPRVQLTQQQIDELRAQIERGFQDLPGVRIRPTQDTAETLSFLSGGSSTEASIRNYLKKAKDVTALIRFTPVKLSDGGNPTVSVRMRAITLKFSCSGVVDMRLPLLGKTLQDVDGVFESFARAFYSRNRATTVVAPAFRHRKGEQSECNILLQNRLVAALTSLRPAAINGRPATIRREPPNRPPNAKPDRGLVIIEGTYFYRRDPGKKGTRLWISLGAHRGGDILEQMPEVEVRKPHCNPLPLDFFQIIRNGAKSNKGKLNVFTKGQFRVDDDAVITVFSFTSRPVYCWYINPERTAYILTPNPRQQGRLTTEREITREFPRDFGLPPQRFSQVSNDMFGCFLPPRDISATEAHKRWMSLWGAKELSEAQIFEMLDRMRAIPGMVEDYADIVIINKK